MKFIVGKALRLLRRDAKQSLRYTREWFAAHWAWIMLSLATAVLAGVVFLLPADDALLAAIQPGTPATVKTARTVAGELTHYGDFARFNLGLFLGMQILGWTMRSRRLLRLASASLLCAMLTGLAANGLRLFVGRPRPLATETARTVGLADKYHSFPSAHTATAFGAALPLLFSAPAIGVPVTLAACSVGWARLQLQRHHPTDVLASVLLSIVFALPLSRWSLLGRRIAIVTPNAPPPSRKSH